MRFLKGIVPAVLLATAPLSLAKKDKPDISVSTFKSPLVNLFYFDDTETVIGQEFDSNIIWRSEDGGKKWDKIKDLPEVAGVVHSPFDNSLAIAIGISLDLKGPHKHWITYDKGKSWKEFQTELPASIAGPPINFHSGDNKKIIFNTAEDCVTAPCLGKSWYTKDGFESKPKLLNGARKMCNWARSAPEFLADKEEKYEDRVLCITKGKYSIRSKDFRLLVSDNYFEDDTEPVMASGRTVPGMVNMATVKNFFVVAAKAENSNELALYTTDDTEKWHRAEFGDHKIEEDAYTVLESTNYSIQVDVVTNRWSSIGTLFTSNSNGTYFTKNIEHTNRNLEGYVDFEKISNIRGIVMVNVVDNWKEAGSPIAEKKLKSQISFDDGRSFHPLKADGKDLHLHSVTNQHNSGRVFSSPAPGIVMGVGNTGDSLRKYKDGDLYVSDDAGLTWELALKEAHKYEFGDSGSILVAVYDEDETDTIMYSLRHGKPDTWKKIELDFKIRAHELTTIPDSTSLQFILVAMKHKDNDREPVVISIDFEGLHERDCKDSDFETWYARVDEDGKPTCVMGEKTSFRRRKWDSECFINQEFKDPVPQFEACECDEAKDYECDYNFVPHWNDKGEKSCKPSPAYVPPKGACKEGEKSFKGSSGWRKIPGNKCTGKTKKDEEAEHDCKDIERPGASGDIESKVNSFKGKNFLEYFYLESPPAEDGKAQDETIVMLTTEREAYVTHDHGKKWERAVDEEVVAIYPHQYSNDRVYFITPTKKVFYSLDYGRKGSIHHFDAPARPNAEFLQILAFHPDTKENPDWLIWIGAEDCRAGSKDCHSTAYVSTKGGREWNEMLPWVKKCSFMWREAGRGVGEKLVFCEQHAKEEKDGLVQLIASEDWFEHKDTRFKSVVAFATMSEFIIVATKGEDGKSLKLDASLDGKTFADARFPPKFNVEHQTAYTVLDSSTHSVFVHVTVNPIQGQEYGAIIKSNSNGTSYVLSASDVNRNTDGYVDFEKMQGIEGVAIINVVANREQVDNDGAKKKKQSKITHNDGADWEFIQPPKKDSDDKPFKCDTGNWKNGECSLHLHGYTERGDPRETFSSPTAVGVMMGVGNVGDSLQTIGEAATFMTTDGGISWKEVKKGTYAWEFGDQGSVIVIVRRGEDTNHLYYSIDNGAEWNRYDFSDKAIRVGSITTVPSDTSLNFLLWGKDGTELVTVNVDFSGLFERQCDLDEKDPETGDYELWSPQHPLSDDQQCLFGHVAQYHRKRKEATTCYNGRKIDHLHSVARNCTCTRRDFECDFNFERKPGGECVLIEGLEPLKGEEVCKQKGVKEWWEITGYRKIPISTCKDGREMEHTSTVHPCPGFEDEFQRKHGIGGFGLFMAIVVPFAVAGGVGYYVWKHCDGKFGRIRLGDSTNTFDSGSPWISWPVAAISGLVAVVAAVPLLIGAAWRSVSGMFGGYGGRTYTSRSSFARGRGEYTGVASDEGELLGDDSDEDV